MDVISDNMIPLLKTGKYYIISKTDTSTMG